MFFAYGRQQLVHSLSVTTVSPTDRLCSRVLGVRSVKRRADAALKRSDFKPKFGTGVCRLNQSLPFDNPLMIYPSSSSRTEKPAGSAGSIPPRGFWSAPSRGERGPARGGGLRCRPPLGLPPDERSGCGGGGSCCRGLRTVPCGESEARQSHLSLQCP